MDINKILESAIHAPSGDNCQPWRFVIKGNQIRVFNLPERDTSLYNFRQRASLIAHGAIIENIVIASSASGCKASLRVFPDRMDLNLISVVELEKSDTGNEPLYDYIPQRSTNRKPYKSTPITPGQKKSLFDASKYLSEGELRLLEKPQEKKVVAKALGINDRLVFENPHLHKFLFDHIRWTKEEAQKTGDGLDIRTLEITGPQISGFRLLRNWPLVQKLNLLGLSRLVAKKAEKLCVSASAIGLIIIENDRDEDFLTGGRLLQRVWLEAARMGLSFHPMAGIAFLIQRVLGGDTKELSPGHIDLIRDACEGIKTAFNLREETILMLFRIGYSEAPSARSLRLPAEKVSEIV